MYIYICTYKCLNLCEKASVYVFSVGMGFGILIFCKGKRKESLKPRLIGTDPRFNDLKLEARCWASIDDVEQQLEQLLLHHLISVIDHHPLLFSLWLKTRVCTCCPLSWNFYMKNKTFLELYSTFILHGI